MSYYKTCPVCGAALDPGEICECVQRSFSQLTDENKTKINALISEKLEEQEKRAAISTILENAGSLNNGGKEDGQHQN
jgi:hypothetical protein